MAAISFDNVAKVYPDGTRAVSGFDVDVSDGEFMVLVGPSGCGKTTALRMVAGLEAITEGVVRIGDRVVNYVPAPPRRLGQAKIALVSERGHEAQSLGLPVGVRACLFDLDGVLAKTAKLHAAAWKETFDGFLKTRAARTGERFAPFDEVADYDEYVDGKPRYDGVRSFLAARRIELPEGLPTDRPDAETVSGLGNRKNDLVLALIRDKGVEAYEGSIRYVRAVRAAGLRRAVVSSSANTSEVLAAVAIDDLFEVKIDGLVAEREHLKGKPAPDTFLAAARELGVSPAQAAVFEDALAGVAAGRAGRFGFVVGVDRVGQAEALREHGADVVVSDLAELLERA